MHEDWTTHISIYILKSFFFPQMIRKTPS